MTTYKITYQTSTSSRIDTAYVTAGNRTAAMNEARTLIANLINIVTIDEV